MPAAPSRFRSKALQRHVFVVLAISLDVFVVALAVTVNRCDFLLSEDTGRVIQFNKILPALGALIGAAVVAINALAMASLVKAYAKRTVLHEGLTFRDISGMHALAGGSIPSTVTLSLFLFGGTLMLSKAFLPSVIVASLTPTNTNWQAKLRMPLADFSTDSGVVPDMLCEYFQSQGGNQDAIGYGYGVNCPIDSAYGEIYTAGLLTLRGNFPENSTWNGVTYPSSLLGISGAISQVTRQYVKVITKDDSRDIIATDHFDACVPRMIVDVECKKSLQPDQFVNMTVNYYAYSHAPLSTGIVGADLCRNSTGCPNQARFAPHFAGGVIIVFWDMDSSSGNTTLTIYSFGSYKDDMTSEYIQCNIGAHEDLIPIRITGGSSVQSLPSLPCPVRAPAPPKFLLNVTRIAEMAFIKMQGIDGKLEPINYVQNEDKVIALQMAIQRMVATGATNMYEIAYTNSTLTSKWSTEMPFTYTTTRIRLGSSSDHTLAFIISPVLLIVLLLTGWIYVGFKSEGNMPFDPLSPVCIAVAGMNRDVLSPTVAKYSMVGQRKLERLPLNIRYGYVTNDRMGLDTKASELWKLSSSYGELPESDITLEKDGKVELSP
ncbi:hypothetical protein BDQ12DRAFT_763589 [Crucibulum laeve]|uniref:Uncharacterized protein n=1 Tax=Crucibulum laeve TaxID=68775 RepID=A0A5C3LP00_9AGAR|nr:hypothetical protein BDQ12DRAFT_763589 [Crucibulum laeve]